MGVSQSLADRLRRADIAFQPLADRFRRASAAGEAGPGLGDDAIADAGRAVQRAINKGRLDLGEFPKWEMPRGSLPRGLQILWMMIAQKLCFENPDDLPPDPYAMRPIAELDGGDEVLATDPRDWQRRAEHYAAICDWLAVQLGETRSSDPGEPIQEVPPLDKNDVAVLTALRKFSPALIDQYGLEQATRLTRKTIGDSLSSLIEAGLVHRPKGERSGNGLTQAGLTTAKNLVR